MATIAKKCSVCGKLYKAYNYVEIPVSREDDEDQEYDDDEAIDVEVTEDFEPINFEPNGFEFVTIEEDMDIQYDFDNNDLCPECMAVISNFIDTNTPHASGNPVVLEDVAPGTPIEMVVDIQPSQDLHGYDHPWVGGAGKNIYPIAIGRDRFIDNLGATHTTDNDTLTVTFTTTEDSCGVYSPSASSVRSVFASLSGTYTYSFDVKVNVASARVLIGVERNGARVFDLTNSWQRLSITADFSSIASSFDVYNKGRSSGVVVDIKNLQIEQGSTATSYAPYENICPIYPGNGKNLLQVTATSQTINGVTFTVNSDGTVKAVGTSTATTEFRFGRITRDSAKTYYVSGCPKGGSTASYRQTIRFYLNDTSLLTKSDTGDGYKITSVDAPTADEIRISAWIASGQNVDLLYKPMVTESENSMFVPYQGIMVTRTGKNLLDSSKITKTANMALVDGVFVAQPISQGNQIVTLKFSDAAFVGTPVSISFDVWGDGIAEFRFDGQPDAINVGGTDFSDKTVNVSTSKKRLTFSGTFLAGTTSFRIFRTSSYLGSGTVTVNISNIQIEQGSTATPYEPYQSQTVEVTLNDTTYGGTLNVTTGELIVDRAFYTWSSGGTLTSTKAFSLSKSDVVRINASNQTTLKGAICDKMQSGTWQQISNPNATSMYAGCAWGTALAFRVPGYTTAEEYLTFLAENPLQFAYLLKEPQTYHLTPAQIRLLKGSNTIETDAGTINIKYKKAIEGKMEVEA